jgi:hypothetical protein
MSDYKFDVRPKGVGLLKRWFSIGWLRECNPFYPIDYEPPEVVEIYGHCTHKYWLQLTNLEQKLIGFVFLRYALVFVAIGLILLLLFPVIGAFWFGIGMVAFMFTVACSFYIGL